MARWDLAGAAGAVAGPLLLTAVLAVEGDGEVGGGGWRAGFLALAGINALIWLGALLRGRPQPDGRTAAAEAEAEAAAEAEEADQRPWTARFGEIGTALRDWGTLRWVLLIEVADLLVDVFTGFLALYLVDVAHLTPAFAALAIAVRLGAALAGDAALIVILERVSDLTVLRVSAAAAALLYPAFLLVPGVVPKLAVLAVLSAATAPWYPVLQARLYGSLPGRSSVAVTLSSAAGLAGGLGPLAVGLVAQSFGLSWALAGLVLVPVAVLLVPGRGDPEA
jgi:FSR family fosmidomycin resistance protein-like MFS transporter